MSNPFQRQPVLTARQLAELFVTQTTHLQKALLLPMILKSLESCDFNHLRIQISNMLNIDSDLAREHMYDAISMTERWVREAQAHVASAQKSMVDSSSPTEPPRVD